MVLRDFPRPGPVCRPAPSDDPNDQAILQGEKTEQEVAVGVGHGGDDSDGRGGSRGDVLAALPENRGILSPVESSQIVSCRRHYRMFERRFHASPGPYSRPFVDRPIPEADRKFFWSARGPRPVDRRGIE
jgi:hypothetical protein